MAERGASPRGGITGDGAPGLVEDKVALSETGCIQINSKSQRGLTTMGFDAFKEEQEEEGSSQSQSTYVSFKNQDHPKVEVDEDKQHLHSQEYFEAVNTIRDEVGSDINVIFGEFAAGAVEAAEGDSGRLEELFNELSESE